MVHGSNIQQCDPSTARGFNRPSNHHSPSTVRTFCHMPWVHSARLCRVDMIVPFHHCRFITHHTHPWVSSYYRKRYPCPFRPTSNITFLGVHLAIQQSLPPSRHLSLASPSPHPPIVLDGILGIIHRYRSPVAFDCPRPSISAPW